MSDTSSSIVKEGAQDLEKIHMRRTRVLDAGAVHLLVILRTKQNEPKPEYAPPVKVLVNGVEFNEINGKNSGEENQCDLWVNAKIKTDGIEKIQITLEPFGGAEQYFRMGISPRRRYEPAYTKNQSERILGKYWCPPRADPNSDFDKQKSDPLHRIEVVVSVKRRYGGLGGLVAVPTEFNLRGLKQSQ